MELFHGTAGLDYGMIISETGNMYSGKTTALIARVEKMELIEKMRRNHVEREKLPYVPLSLGAYKHAIDKRYSAEKIVSHNGISIPATPIECVDDLVKHVHQHNVRIIAVDEIQFFDEKDENDYYKIVLALKQFADEKRVVMVAGLDVDFRGLPFGPMGDIIAISEEKGFHKSVCAVCGAPATLPQRLINGKPAYFDDPIKMVGASEAYEPRCRNHHIVLHRPILKSASNE